MARIIAKVGKGSLLRGMWPVHNVLTGYPEWVESRRMTTAKKPKLMTLPEFVRWMGKEKFAQVYHVSIRSAEHYMYGTRRPNPNSDLAQRLLRSPHLTFDSVWGKKAQRASYA